MSIKVQNLCDRGEINVARPLFRAGYVDSPWDSSNCTIKKHALNLALRLDFYSALVQGFFPTTNGVVGRI